MLQKTSQRIIYVKFVTKIAQVLWVNKTAFKYLVKGFMSTSTLDRVPFRELQQCMIYYFHFLKGSYELIVIH